MSDIGYIVKDHVPALMQLVTHELPQYNMQLVTTKCLNTAVMFMYLFLGKKAFKYTEHCDVPNVQRRYGSGGDAASSDLLRSFKKDVLSRRSKGRTLYYVMLTDGHVDKVQAADMSPSSTAQVDKLIESIYTHLSTPHSTETHVDTAAGTGTPTGRQREYFPGHVFLIDKLPASAADAGDNRPRYNLYQSYIDEYDFSGHVDRNKSCAYSYERMAASIDELAHIFHSDAWDDRSSSFWRSFTFVDGSQWLGHRFSGSILFCYTRVCTKGCVKQLRTFLQSKLSELERDWPRLQPDEVYGMDRCKDLQAQASSGAIGRDDAAKACYRLKQNSSTPLTNRQMRSELQKMLQKI